MHESIFTYNSVEQIVKNGPGKRKRQSHKFSHISYWIMWIDYCHRKCTKWPHVWMAFIIENSFEMTLVLLANSVLSWILFVEMVCFNICIYSVLYTYMYFLCRWNSYGEHLHFLIQYSSRKVLKIWVPTRFLWKETHKNDLVCAPVK